ncbi:hypothetical protein BVI1335_320126 [Burkholderia vietnamiensis]|nr:hypothetical protein BVI1335_320126 [Burkholderia vietnamiensis]
MSVHLRYGRSLPDPEGTFVSLETDH